MEKGNVVLKVDGLNALILTRMICSFGRVNDTLLQRT